MRFVECVGARVSASLAAVSYKQAIAAPRPQPPLLLPPTHLADVDAQPAVHTGAAHAHKHAAVD